MKIEKIESGIHTVELYAKNLKYQEVQKVIDRLAECGVIWKMRSDPYNIDRCVASTFLVKDGIRLRIHQSHDKSNGIAFIINPSTLLAGRYQPTKLYHPKARSFEELLERLETVLIEIGLGEYCDGMLEFAVTPEELSLSQIDLTLNLWFDEETDLEELIRLFRKGQVPKTFKRKEGLPDGERQHYFGMSNQTVAFKAYDKIYELQINGRCPEELKGQKVLRLEVSLKREALLKKLSVERTDPLYEQLKAGFHMVQDVISHYLKKLIPCSGVHVRYEKACKGIQTRIKDPVLQEQMLFLLKKTSSGVGLDTAARKLVERYHDRNGKIFKRALENFDHLDVNPITLANSSTKAQLPSMRNLITKS
ncbi:hypothetical protein [uncultured Flavonifractor sp.]|uniref:hypothetical protein n=1 Tax=uncultured Flavonifractor sp. TaxID=1193534 RepID=UPI00174D663B|nr:hypothetical protein [uncultured Flavonifractor sp.]